MKNHKVADIFKNAVGTVFLLAGTFFVCSTLVSIRAVFADPIAPAAVVQSAQQSPRNTARNSARATANAASRTTASRAAVNRTTVNGAQNNSASRATTSSRAVSSRANTSASRANASSRNVSSRAKSANVASSRSVVARSATTPRTTVGDTNNNRNVRARVSLQGSAIRGSKSTTSSTYTYLSGKLYTGNYSNIIDTTTGLISAEAYSNCLESYYTCMDEICTARNAAQGRCACAYRTKAFATAEKALETANEELIKVSGELALLVATKGKDVSSAFQLTDAEKVMNCVSFKEVKAKNNTDELNEWCINHGIYGSCTMPSYCKTNNFGFDVDQIEGTSSDILASLRAWADAKDSAAGMLINDEDNLLGAYTNISSIVSSMAGVSDKLNSDSTGLDSLANTWGYELFEYAHNNVCSRVLDSCFNGIYEACGSVPSGGRCANGKSSGSCPYNYNSKISVSASGDVTLNERGASTGSSSASCFGYTSTDPYETLRGPVADARRSVMQKYLLDANAACDVYGEQLRTAAQNIGYQKVAAQQALQQKRMEFANEETETIASDYRNAINNFNECLSELYSCYTETATSNPTWSTARIKTYCSTVAESPSCYEPMVCGAPNNKLAAVITVDAGDKACNNSEIFAENNCRNVVTISEILNGSYAASAASGSSAQMREACLQKISIEGVRRWSKNDTGDEWQDYNCASNEHYENGQCVSNTRSCTPNDANGQGTQTWNNGWNTACQLTSCNSGYVLENGACRLGDDICGDGMHYDGSTCVI